MSNKNALFYMADVELPLVSHADGGTIWDKDGNAYLDACSGAITTNMGHNHAAIKQAMIEQLDKVSFAYRTQFENEAAIALADRLVALSNGDLQKAFFVGSGSEAVESTIKLARQYFYAVGQTQRQNFISLRPSYHGGTLGALSLTSYHPLEAPFSDIAPVAVKVPSPDFYRFEEADLDAHVDALLAKTEAEIKKVGGESIAAFVLEPVGGASTGARMLNARYVKGIRALCDQYGFLLIFDEVLSGMGRTGKPLAYQHYGVKPDLVALAKGLGAGYYPIAAMLAREELVDAVMKSGGFQHGHTYAGNPLACATGLAILNAMEEEKVVENAAEQGAYLRARLEELQAKHAIIGQVRGIGLLQGIEFVADQVSKKPFPASDNIFSRITQIAKKNGLLIYPRRSLNGLEGDHVLITPRLNIPRQEVDQIIELLDRSLSELEEQIRPSGS